MKLKKQLEKIGEPQSKKKRQIHGKLWTSLNEQKLQIMT